MVLFRLMHLIALLTSMLLTQGVATAAMADEIQIEVKQFGVGNTWRPGETNGLLIELTGQGNVEEQVLVEWELPTPDGDVMRYGRTLTVSAHQARSTWLYGLLPHDVDPETGMRLRVSRIEDGTPGELLGVKQFQPRTTSSTRLMPTTALLGVIGPNRVGLDQLSNQSGNLNERPHSSNEATVITTISDASDLPDRWEGWRPFEAVVWTNTEPDLRPSQLTALREWMRRGGNLVIVLPSTGTPWNIGGENAPLGDLMPSPPRRDEQVSLGRIRKSLSKQPVPLTSGTMPVRVFSDLQGSFNALPEEQGWRSMHALDDGRVWAVQRPVGHGRLTLVGLDLTAAALRNTPGRGLRLPEADVVWNRLLGRRADTPNLDMITAMKNAKRLNTLRPTDVRTVTGDVVSEPIAMSERAGSGLLLAFGFFLLYWLVAIPGTWWWLKRRNQQNWSWAAYALTAVVFTIIGWLAVELLQDRSMRVRHLTVLDHVVHGDGQHARSWFSLYWPGYGDREVEIEPDRGTRNLLQPWSSAEDDSLTFPDSTNIRVDLDQRPDRSMLPGRGTSTHLFADWYGLVDRGSWGGMLQEDPDDPVRLERDATGRDIGLRGSIINNLPQDLEHVRITWVTGKRFPKRRLERSGDDTQPWIDPLDSGGSLNHGYAWGKSNLAIGRRLDLSSLELTTSGALDTFIESRYSPPLSTGFNRLSSYTDNDRRTELELLGLYNQLPPPTYHQAGETLTKSGATHRPFGRELDLSPWLARPCLIITGFLDSSELPVPLVVDGDSDAVDSSGLTMVRWILPLPQHDPAAFDQ